MENPWLTFDYTSRNQVHEQDQESFDRFNSKVKKLKNGKNLELSSSHTPLPYFGNLRAGFVILMANPGLDPVNTSLEEKPHMRRLFDAARKHEEVDSPFVFLDDAFAGTPGQTWWSKRLGSIIDEVGLEKVRKGIFSAEIHPYKSINYRPLGEQMPTQFYTAEVVRKFIDQGALFLLGRARKEWQELMPEFHRYKNVIELNSKQNSYITQGNTSRSKFKRIISAIAG